MDKERTKEILKKVREVEIRTNRLVDDSLAGHYHSVFKGRGMDFEDVREYVPGDEIRSIDWNVTARSGRPFVKNFREERELTILLLIDVSASGDFGSDEKSKREIAADLASVIAFSALKNGDKVGLILFTDEVELYIPPRKSRSHILRVIREILFFQPSGKKTNLASVLDFVNRVASRRAVTFLISDFCLPGEPHAALAEIRPKLRATNRHHDVIAVSVTDPREMELPDVGLLTLEDAETGELLEVDTGRASVRESFAELAAARSDLVRRTAGACGVDMLPVRTDEPWLPVLLSFFGRRRRRIAS
jgi:uncharacterized protein (DUF58 family)